MLAPLGAHAADLMYSEQAAPGGKKVSGHVEAFGQASWQGSYWGDEYDPWLGFGGAARVNVWHGDGASFQFDFSAGQSKDSYENEYYTGDMVAAIHYAHRSDDKLYGLFGGIAATATYDFNSDFSGFIGVEGQHYFGDTTIYGQIGWFQRFVGYEEDYNIGVLFAEAAIRHYVTPNTKIEGRFGIVSGEIFGDGYDDMLAYTYAVEVEHKVDDSPFSVFGGVGGHTEQRYGDSSIVTARAGFKIHWGEATLIDQERHGAALRVMDFAPVSWTSVLD